MLKARIASVAAMSMEVTVSHVGDERCKAGGYLLSVCFSASSYIVRRSSSPVVFYMIKARKMMPAVLRKKRQTANFAPSCVTSNNIMGILVVDQAPIKIKMLVSDAPFFRNTLAAGKEA